MRSIHLYVAPVAATLLFGLLACGGNLPPPKQLVDARAEYQRAKNGIAMQLDPTDLHDADLALQRAEAAWRDSGDPNDEHPIDLAIVAQRKAQIASAEAAAAKAQQDAAQAKSDLQAAMQAQLQATKGQLNQTQQTLNQTQTQLQQTAAQAAAQKAQLADLSARLQDARDTIAKIAAVKDDNRGMVITLQGEVLFKTGEWNLKPAAMAKLDQIADALRGKEQPMVVYGYTDNVGTYEKNMDLSQKRAQSVRDYLATKGIPGDLITAQGKGPDNPVAENTSVDGRAQNRRVEIVVQPKKS
jgi:outer membrane protein OmpA-like peptidoglycan-associated protein